MEAALKMATDDADKLSAVDPWTGRSPDFIRTSRWLALFRPKSRC
jgi:hypothetical protein